MESTSQKAQTGTGQHAKRGEKQKKIRKYSLNSRHACIYEVHIQGFKIQINCPSGLYSNEIYF